MIDYNIIATGSKGNAVVIDQKILIDCGVSFKALSKVYRALKLVLLTHIHSDHFQPTTLRLLAENRPTHKIFREYGPDEKKRSECDYCKAAHPNCDKCCKACDEPCNAVQACRKDEERTENDE